jgi:hypothetical protein
MCGIDSSHQDSKMEGMSNISLVERERGVCVRKMDREKKRGEDKPGMERLGPGSTETSKPWA